MMPASLENKYIVISPVKDEERYIGTMVRSMLRQTLKPTQWIIVDDGSRDKSLQMITEATVGNKWIRIVRIDREAPRQPGASVIRAFIAGFELVKSTKFDFVVKLDCDLDLPPDYFERLVCKFNEDNVLGIASGQYLEDHGNKWTPISMPFYHASGASKMIRAQCFADIQGFVPARGWDTLDQIRAQLHGWKTRHFPEIQFRHLKPEGTGIGFIRTNVMHGEIFYLTGGGVLFLLLKVAHRLVKGKPFFVGGIGMLWGFSKCWATGKKRLVNHVEARFYRNLLNQRIWNRLSRDHKDRRSAPQDSLAG